MTTQVNPNGTSMTTTAPTFTEAPASATIKVTSPSGLEWMLTTRAATMRDLIAQVTTLETWLVGNKWTPAATRAASALPMSAPSVTPAEPAPICAIHKTPMTRRSKDGRSWWSCSEKLDDGSWCPYRPK